MTYTMTFDNSWELMSEDEMYDVNGGLYLDQSTVDSLLMGIIGTVVASPYGISGVALLVKGSAGYIVSALGSLGPVGLVIGVLGSAYVVAHATEIAEALVTASIHRQGIDLNFGWKWGIIPWIVFSART